MPLSRRKTPAHPAVLTHLQSMLEAERTTVARELHDEMGGLLVAAVMDVAWAEQNASSNEVRYKLTRVRQTLATAIDLKRTLIEQLRPSLLDNFGLFSACRWHVKHSCAHAGIPCKDQYPVEEPPFTPEAKTGLYRILQEALAITLDRPAVKSLSVMITVDEVALKISIAHEAPQSPARNGETTETQAIAMAAMKHRVTRLGGKLRVQALKKGGVVITTQVPVANSLQPAGVPTHGP